jgi:hypothetical protein
MFELFEEILIRHRGVLPDDFSLADFMRERARTSTDLAALQPL